MAITAVNVGVQNANNASPLTPTLPSSIQAGDLLLVICLQSSAAAITFNPSGYTSLGRNSDATQAMTLEVFAKIATASESAPSTTCSSATAGWCVQMAAYRGTNRTLAVLNDATVVNSSSAAAATFQPTQITTATNGAMVLSVVGTKDDNALNYSNQNSFTDRMSGANYDNTLGNGSDYSVGLADIIKTTAGAQTCPTWNQSINGNDAWIGLTIALKPEVPVVVNGAAPTALTTTRFVPTVTRSQNVTVACAAPTSLTTTRYAAVIRKQILIPATALALTGFAPTVTVTGGTIPEPAVVLITQGSYVAPLGLQPQTVVLKAGLVEPPPAYAVLVSIGNFITPASGPVVNTIVLYVGTPIPPGDQVVILPTITNVSTRRPHDLAARGVDARDVPEVIYDNLNPPFLGWVLGGEIWEPLLGEDGVNFLLEEEVTATGELSISLALIGPTATAHTPTVTAGAVTLSLPLIGPTSIPFTPTLSPGPVTLALVLIGPTSLSFIPSIAGAGTLALSALGPTSTAFAPTLTPGPVTLSLSLIGPTAIPSVPSVLAQNFVSLPAISATQVFAPSLTPSNNVSLPTIAGTQVFAPALSALSGIGMPAFGPTSVLRSPTLVPGPVTLTNAAISSGSQTFVPSVARELNLAAIGPTSIARAPSLTTVAFMTTASISATLVHPLQLAGQNSMSMSTIPSGSVVYVPSVAINIINAFKPSGAALFGPQLSPAVALSLSTIPSGSQLHPPSAVTEGNLVIPHIGPTGQVYPPSIDQLRRAFIRFDKELEFCPRYETVLKM